MSSGSRRSRNDPAANEETSWKVVEIMAEDGKRYNVRWAGKDPKTGKPWPLSWVPNSHCSPELIKEWERKKAKKESSFASSSSFKSPQAPTARSRPTNRSKPTNPPESVVPPTRKRKHPFPSNTDDDSKSPKKRKNGPSDGPPHPPFEEIEMWVPTPTAKFGPPKRKHAAAKPRDPPKERRRDSIISTVTSMRTQAPLAVSRQPVGLSKSQIIALREEEEESQPQPPPPVSRPSQQLGSASQESAPSGPLQTLTGDGRGKAVENAQEVRDNLPMNRLSADSQPLDRNTKSSHVLKLGFRDEFCHLQDNVKNLSIHGGNENLETSLTLTGPTRKSLVNPEVPAVISPSTKSLLPENPDPRPIANSTPSSGSVEQLGPLKYGPERWSSGTLADRRALEARLRLEVVRRGASRTTENPVEGRSSTSIALESATQPLPHVVLQQIMNGLESPTQSQAAPMEKNLKAPPSEPREAGLSVQSKDDMVTQGKSDIDVGAAAVSPRVNEPSPPDEVPPTTQGSTQTQSLNISSQASLGDQLAAALNLLHKKSEEISELQAQVDALREQPASAKLNPGEKRAGSEQPFSTKGTDQVATGVQTDQVREAQAALDLERAQWAEEKTALQSETDALRTDKTQALTDVEFFREQYQKASAFASSTRSENEELLARATLAESQTVNGIAMIRATFEARVDKLEAEVRKYKTISEMLTERARRTDDDVRYRAAIAPELEREYQRLHRQLEEREAELDETNDELRAEKKVNTRLRKLVARLEAEGPANGRNSHDRAPPLRSSDENDDEDYVPGTSPSSSPPIENGSGSPPRVQQAPGPNNEKGVTMLAEKDIERLAGDDSASRTKARTNGDMVYLCWWRSSEGNCDAIVASKRELHEHVLSYHLACH